MKPEWDKIALPRSLSGSCRSPQPQVKGSRTPSASSAYSSLLLRNFMAFNHFAFPLRGDCNLKRRGPIQKEQVLNGLC